MRHMWSVVWGSGLGALFSFVTSVPTQVGWTMLGVFIAAVLVSSARGPSK